jgi:hypothetical protein
MEFFDAHTKAGFPSSTYKAIHCMIVQRQQEAEDAPRFGPSLFVLRFRVDRKISQQCHIAAIVEGRIPFGCRFSCPSPPHLISHVCSGHSAKCMYVAASFCLYFLLYAREVPLYYASAFPERICDISEMSLAWHVRLQLRAEKGCRSARGQNWFS